MTTYGAPSSSSAAAASASVVHTRDRAVGTPAAAITSLANALEPSSWAAAADGPNTAIPRRGHGVRDTGHQRRLRPDDDKVDSQPLGQVGDRRPVHRVHRVALGDPGHARVARRRVDGGHRGVEGQGSGEGVLAAAGTDDQGTAGGTVGTAHVPGH